MDREQEPSRLEVLRRSAHSLSPDRRVVHWKPWAIGLVLTWLTASVAVWVAWGCSDASYRGISVDGDTGRAAILRAAVPLQPNPRLVVNAWRYDVACAGVPRFRNPGVSNVAFVVVPAGSIRVDRWPAYGYHFDDGLILLDAAYFDDFWLLAHELLHHLVPPHGGDAHPWIPFGWPCQVMSGQHSLGGVIMNAKPGT